MKNFHKTYTFYPMFQRNGLYLQYILPFCLIGLLFFSSNVLLGQPGSFTIAGCNAAANGDYTRSVHDSNGCPCYDKAGGEVMIKVGNNWSVSTNGASCTSAVMITTRIYTGGSDPCDISTATTHSCSPATTLSFPINSTASVPTLSEWGLIILALLLMTLGTLYLVQQPRFEQER